MGGMEHGNMSNGDMAGMFGMMSPEKMIQLSSASGAEFDRMFLHRLSRFSRGSDGSRHCPRLAISAIPSRQNAGGSADPLHVRPSPEPPTRKCRPAGAAGCRTSRTTMRSVGLEGWGAGRLGAGAGR